MSDHVNGDVLPIEFMAKREDFRKGISLYARQVTYGVGQKEAKPLEFKEVNESLMAMPFTTLSIQAAQQLMDELWQCGLRPSEGTGSAGSLAATERHLDDMRKIIFERHCNLTKPTEEIL